MEKKNVAIIFTYVQRYRLPFIPTSVFTLTRHAHCNVNSAIVASMIQKHHNMILTNEPSDDVSK